jgi:hypothetical protein
MCLMTCGPKTIYNLILEPDPLPQSEHRQRLNPIICDELVKGEFLPRTLADCTEPMRGLKEEAGCDRRRLCSQRSDSTRILARAGLRQGGEDGSLDGR